MPLRVCGKVVFLQCRSGTFRAYSVTTLKGSRQHRKTKELGSEDLDKVVSCQFLFCKRSSLPIYCYLFTPQRKNICQDKAVQKRLSFIL